MFTVKLSPASYGVVVGTLCIAFRDMFGKRHIDSYISPDSKRKMMRDQIKAIRELRKSQFGV